MLRSLNVSGHCGESLSIGECKIIFCIIYIDVFLLSNCLSFCGAHFLCLFVSCRFVVEVVKLYCHVMVTVSSDVVVFVCMYICIVVFSIYCVLSNVLLFQACRYIIYVCRVGIRIDHRCPRCVVWRYRKNDFCVIKRVCYFM